MLGCLDFAISFKLSQNLVKVLIRASNEDGSDIKVFWCVRILKFFNFIHNFLSQRVISTVVAVFNSVLYFALSFLHVFYVFICYVIMSVWTSLAPIALALNKKAANVCLISFMSLPRPFHSHDIFQIFKHLGIFIRQVEFFYCLVHIIGPEISISISFRHLD